MSIETIVERLDRIVRDVVPEATAVTKYGGTLYMLRPDEKEGQFRGVFPYAKHVQLSFSRGDLLDDPGGMLDGGGKCRRHLNVADVADILEGDVRRFVEQASRTA